MKLDLVDDRTRMNYLEFPFCPYLTPHLFYIPRTMSLLLCFLSLLYFFPYPIQMLGFIGFAQMLNQSCWCVFITESSTFFSDGLNFDPSAEGSA